MARDTGRFDPVTTQRNRVYSLAKERSSHKRNVLQAKSTPEECGYAVCSDRGATERWTGRIYAGQIQEPTTSSR